MQMYGEGHRYYRISKVNINMSSFNSACPRRPRVFKLSGGEEGLTSDKGYMTLKMCEPVRT